jgi:acyl-CoA reductase-like NAD-dependent aldehyde dehydrogenase
MLAKPGHALSTRYGTSCGVMPSQCDAGTVWVNKHADLSQDTPYSGAKQSGLGVGLGLEGLEEFTQATIINAAK